MQHLLVFAGTDDHRLAGIEPVIRRECVPRPAMHEFVLEQFDERRCARREPAETLGATAPEAAALRLYALRPGVGALHVCLQLGVEPAEQVLVDEILDDHAAVCGETGHDRVERRVTREGLQTRAGHHGSSMGQGRVARIIAARPRPATGARGTCAGPCSLRVVVALDVADEIFRIEIDRAQGPVGVARDLIGKVRRLGMTAFPAG